MSHAGGGPSAVVMRRPDGTPMTRDEVVRERRGAFKWLPVVFSNDLVHGSWWFVLGSLLSMVIAIIPLGEKALKYEQQNDDKLPRLDQDVTWSLLTICGFFYTVGSYAFVRAFEEPPKLPLFHYIKHLQTDELLGAWLFLFGTIPAVPWSLVYLSLFPGFTYLAMLLMSLMAVLACALFVLACYPNDRKSENYLLPCCVQFFGSRIWMVKHLANDWLAGTWFFLWVSIIFTIASFGYLCIALSSGAGKKQVFTWSSGFVDSLLFLIGSLYFVSGSYPHASQFYYAINKGGNPNKIEKREIHTFKRTHEVALAKLGTPQINSGGPIGTKSQTMDLRLDVVLNPLYEQVASSAGEAKSTTTATIAEIRDKLQNTVAALKSSGNSTTNLIGSIPIKPGDDKHDIESGMKTSVSTNEVMNPLLVAFPEHLPGIHPEDVHRTETEGAGGNNSNSKSDAISLLVRDDSNEEDDDVEIDTTHVDMTSPLSLVTRSAKERAREPKLQERNG